MSCKFFWSELNAGYSNYGPVGGFAVNFRTARTFFGTTYNKSHVCFQDNIGGEYYSKDINSDSHLTITAMSVYAGIILPAKWNPSLSLGASWYQFNYLSTRPIACDVSLPRIWATIINRPYREVRLKSQVVNAIGIPIEVKLHFMPKHFVGFDAGFRVDVNTHSTIVSATAGIRLGKIIERHQL